MEKESSSTNTAICQPSQSDDRPLNSSHQKTHKKKHHTNYANSHQAHHGSSDHWRRNPKHQSNMRHAMTDYYSQPHHMGMMGGGAHETDEANTQHHDQKNVQKRVPYKSQVSSENQRERLIEQLCQGQYECMICYNVVKPHVATISCAKCYHIYHLYCVKQWSRAEAQRTTAQQRNAPSENQSSQQTTTPGSWRCPACQLENDSQAGFRYKCFCGQQRDPVYSPHLTPHTCGELCGKLRSEHCSHPCNILCHPGPCPPCEAFIKVNCACGRTSTTVKCSVSHLLRCENVCGRVLNCGQHQCDKVCHTGDCAPCEVTMQQNCHCGQNTHSVVCGGPQVGEETFSCGRVCSRQLECGNHSCSRVCHSGPCPSCSRLPENVAYCPCGKKLLCELVTSGNPSGDRVTCMDAIPHCDSPCGRKLPLCGHPCEVVCHEGDCPPCPHRSSVTCRCGRWTRQMLCSKALQLSRSGQDVLCEKVCKKMKSCGVHRCGQSCCIDFDHHCGLQCGKMLSCGIHTCESACHQGVCNPCQRMNLTGVSCHCGGMFIPPPVPCGTPPPQCPYPCSRERHCEHAVDHPCHPCPPDCPPCTVLMDKLCPGGHTVLTNIPCYQDVVTCGFRCNRPLPTCSHLCPRPCHVGENCNVDAINGREFPCKQPCMKPRPLCQHPCGVPCHEASGTTCEECWRKGNNKAMRCTWPMKISCSCGHKVEQCPCWQFVEKRNALSMPDSITMTTLSLKDTGDSKEDAYVMLQCDSSCLMEKRVAALAEAVQQQRAAAVGAVETAQSSSTNQPPEAPPYVAFLKEFGAKNLPFVYQVEEEFEKLIRNVYQSTKPSFTFHFPPMHFDKRRFIHELSDFYHLASESYGNKPNRNVMLVAMRNKSFVPPVKLSAVLIRENPSLKPPAPVKRNPVLVPMSKIESFTSTMTQLGGGSSSNAPNQSSSSQKSVVEQAAHSGWWNAMENPDQPL